MGGGEYISLNQPEGHPRETKDIGKSQGDIIYQKKRQAAEPMSKLYMPFFNNQWLAEMKINF